MNPPERRAASWYPHPDDPTKIREWDGERWVGPLQDRADFPDCEADDPPAPGWYPFPKDLSKIREWDGERWVGVLKDRADMHFDELNEIDRRREEALRRLEDRARTNASSQSPSLKSVLAPVPVKKSGCGVGCLIFIISLVVIIVISSIVFASRGPDHSSDMAIAECEVQVKKDLKSPSTADFQLASAIGADVDWTVSGTVDSENGFGATLRSYYGCTVHFSGDTADVHVTSLG